MFCKIKTYTTFFLNLYYYNVKQKTALYDLTSGFVESFLIYVLRPFILAKDV